MKILSELKHGKVTDKLVKQNELELQEIQVHWVCAMLNISWYVQSTSQCTDFSSLWEGGLWRCWVIADAMTDEQGNCSYRNKNREKRFGWVLFNMVIQLKLTANLSFLQKSEPESGTWFRCISSVTRKNCRGFKSTQK